MRGTALVGPIAGDCGRFIPAHAGNRAASAGAAPPSAVHPRACGEQGSIGVISLHASGSSPRMRGTERPDGRPANTARFIPAHAGNRPPETACTLKAPVHPRACGEQWPQDLLHLLSRGSSPRMRGTALRRRFRADSCRFIPAHAGNRLPPYSPRPRFSVHPRACGEQVCGDRRGHSIGGSSPRMRGTVFLQIIDLPTLFTCQRTYRKKRLSSEVSAFRKSPQNEPG